MKDALFGAHANTNQGFWPSQKPADLAQAAEWIKEGKVKAIVDTKFSFEQAPEAFTRLKTGRARGKIVIEVASEKA
jgi:NADPH:quinone reductase-like Zn-dependent oxidoreductase